MRMLTYFINRAGRGLSATRKAELEKAKALLSKRIQRDKESASESGVIRIYRAQPSYGDLLRAIDGERRV